MTKKDLIQESALLVLRGSKDRNLQNKIINLAEAYSRSRCTEVLESLKGHIPLHDRGLDIMMLIDAEIQALSAGHD